MKTTQKTTLVRATAVLLLFGVLVGILSIQAPKMEAAANTSSEIRILTIGDSNTVGLRWNERLADEDQIKYGYPKQDSGYPKAYLGKAVGDNKFLSYRVPLYQLLKLESNHTFMFIGSRQLSFYDKNDAVFKEFYSQPNTSCFVGGSEKTNCYNLPTPDEIKFNADNGLTSVDVWKGAKNLEYFPTAIDKIVEKPDVNNPFQNVAFIHLGTNDIWKPTTPNYPSNNAYQCPSAYPASVNNTEQAFTCMLKKLKDKDPGMKVFIAEIIPAAYPGKYCDDNDDTNPDINGVTFAAPCASYEFLTDPWTNKPASPVTIFNHWLETWCGVNIDSTGRRKCPSRSENQFEVYLVDQYSGFDKERWLFQSDEIHTAPHGECQMALTWYDALQQTFNLTQPPTDFCAAYLFEEITSVEFPPVAVDDLYHTSKGQPLDWPNLLANDIGATGFPHIYYLADGQSLRELEGVAGGWNTNEVAATGAPPVLGGGTLGTNRRNVYYIDMDDRHIHEIAYDEGQQGWIHKDLVMVAAGESETPPYTVGSELAVIDVNGDARIYYLSSHEDGLHVNELAWVLGKWHHRDLTAETGAPAAIPDSALTATTVANDAPRVYYLAQINGDFHLHELKWFVDEWSYSDVTAAGGGLSVYPVSKFSATSIDFEPHVFYVQQEHAGLAIHELAQSGESWVDKDVSSYTTSPENVTASGTLVTNGRDVYYVGQDEHVHQQAWDEGEQEWIHEDLTAVSEGESGTPPDVAGYHLAMATAQGAPRIYYLAEDPESDVGGLKVQELSWTGNGWYHKDLGSKQAVLAMDAGVLGAVTAGTDRGPLTAYLESDPAHGSLTLDPNGHFIYRPDDNFEGRDSFTYRMFDSEAYSELATVNIDVMPCERVAGNVIDNFCFVEGHESWRFWHGDGGGKWGVSTSNPFAGAGSIKVVVNAPGRNIQLYQKELALLPNTTYELSFAAYSEDGQDMGVVVHKHGKPYTNYGLRVRHVDLDKAWQIYRYTFNTPDLADMSDARLRFWFAPYAEAGTIYHIDRVVLQAR